MKTMEEILSTIKVGYSQNGVTNSQQYFNIDVNQLLTKLRGLQTGAKDGSHFIRCPLIVDENGLCKRSNKSAASLASILIIDCDKRFNIDGELLLGAPCPKSISDILSLNNIAHVLYGSYSHYTAAKGNRYRLIIPVNQPYDRLELPPTTAALIKLINLGLKSESLAPASENNSWSQPWYLPRKPRNSSVEQLHIEFLEGKAIDVISAPITFLNKHKPVSILKNSAKPSSFNSLGEIDPIAAFNAQFPLSKLLVHYGYKKIKAIGEQEKWLAPDSTSGIPGITHWPSRNKFYSHHNDEFNDGKAHDAFDLFRVREHLNYKAAVMKAAKLTKAPSGLTVDAHNKCLVRNYRTLSGTVAINNQL